MKSLTAADDLEPVLPPTEKIIDDETVPAGGFAAGRRMTPEELIAKTEKLPFVQAIRLAGQRQRR